MPSNTSPTYLLSLWLLDTKNFGESHRVDSNTNENS